MGVAGLWDILRPAAQARSLSHLALQDGFNRTNPPLRGFRIGIDASIWFFHATYGREGENPELRTLFFRCARLMHTPFLPLFVFDGPRRPAVKRGKRIGKDAHWLTSGMKNIIEAFGFEWRTAPGEAEAELAYLNRIGVIDGILSDDVDNFLFGATLVIRNPSATLTGNTSHSLPSTNHTTIYALSTITANPSISLTRGGLILVGLLAGGDYHKGLDGCGMKVAVGLARCGFGDELLEACVRICGGTEGEADEAEKREELQIWLDTWRASLATELRTNSHGHLPSKRAALAKILLSSSSGNSGFPDIDVLLNYTAPVTSETDTRSRRNKIEVRWEREPDLGKVAGLCEIYFEWGWRERIIKRFRTVLWTGAVCRILRRAAIEADRKKAVSIPSTPRKKQSEDKNERVCGTPSKMIAKHFSSLSISSPNPTHDQNQNQNQNQDSDSDSEEPLITKIHSVRTHLTTDHLPEYRLEIAPAQLVRLVEGGIKGIRVPPAADDVYVSDDDDEHDGGGGGDSGSDGDDAGGKGKKGNSKGKGKEDPDSHMRIWMPACMVKLVEPELVAEFEEGVRKKEEKKAGKGKGRGKAKANTESGGGGIARAKAKGKEKEKGSTLPIFEKQSDEEREGGAENAPSKPSKKQTQTQPKATTKTKTKPKPIIKAVHVDISDGSMDSDSVRQNLRGYFTAVVKPKPNLGPGPGSKPIGIGLGEKARLGSPPALPSVSLTKVNQTTTTTKVTSGVAATNATAKGVLGSILNGSQSKAKARSKPKPIPHVPLYLSDSEPDNGGASLSVPRSGTKGAVSAPVDTYLGKGKAKALGIQTSHMDMFLREDRRPISVQELRPFPMSLDDDFGFGLDYRGGDPDVDEGVYACDDEDDDPFLDADVYRIRLSPRPMGSLPKQGRRKSVQSSDSEREIQIRKSPRKAREHTSPKKTSPRHPSSTSDRDRERQDEDDWRLDMARAGSPSPVRPRPKTKPQPQPQSKLKKLQLPKPSTKPIPDDGIIEISSGDDTPPHSLKPMKAPLLLARAKYSAQTKATITKETFIMDACTWNSDVIDLT